jgi:hypothetical protein
VILFFPYHSRASEDILLFHFLLISYHRFALPSGGVKRSGAHLHLSFIPSGVMGDPKD